VTGIIDVYIEKFSFGNGSFSIYAITDNTLNSVSAISNIENAIKDVVAFGIKYYISLPKNIEIALKVKLMFKGTITTSRMQDIRINVRENIKRYINSRGMGESIIANELTEIIMAASSDIVNYSVSEFRVNNILVDFKDQILKKNERFILSSKQDDLIVN
jgi:uncharacterized phage protein gp47/JayE